VHPSPQSGLREKLIGRWIDQWVSVGAARKCPLASRRRRVWSSYSIPYPGSMTTGCLDEFSSSPTGQCHGTQGVSFATTSCTESPPNLVRLYCSGVPSLSTFNDSTCRIGRVFGWPNSNATSGVGNTAVMRDHLRV